MSRITKNLLTVMCLEIIDYQTSGFFGQHCGRTAMLKKYILRVNWVGGGRVRDSAAICLMGKEGGTGQCHKMSHGVGMGFAFG